MNLGTKRNHSEIFLASYIRKTESHYVKFDSEVSRPFLIPFQNYLNLIFILVLAGRWALVLKIQLPRYEALYG